MTRNGFALLFIAGCAAIAAVALSLRQPGTAPPSPAVSAPPTSWPDYSADGPGFQTPAMADGELIAYGYKLITQTFAVIGPEAPDPSLRLAGNNLSCQNCHLDGGTNRGGLPLVGVFGTYPKYRERDRRVDSLVDRLNDCMMRSMNGQPMPEGSREMAALLAFLNFIGKPQPVAARPAPPPPQPADAARGAIVFAAVCAACHQSDGLGVRLGSANVALGYRFPPLWGPDSFNDGAGMDRFENAVGFIRHNMPRGVDPQNPQLSLQQAWDVVAYLKTMPRPKEQRPR
ncbi:MAG: c-type cytochrome [Reyranella sp.]|nr:c-type cytochrome [Reyranella sp.]